MKKYIYLISPQNIKRRGFYKNLNKVLKTNKVKYFQLRLKKTSNLNLLKISKKIKKIAKRNNVKFLINDKPFVAKIVNADGCHIGQKDFDVNFFVVKAFGIMCQKHIGIGPGPPGSA